MRKKRGNAAVNAFSLRHENSKTQLSYGKMHIDWVISILCARSVLFDLVPNILTSSPLTKSISTYYGTPPVQPQSAHCLSHSTDALNLLSPNIHMQILQTDPHAFPLRISWENLIKYPGIFSLMIILLILITLSLDNVWILLGENCYWSLLGLTWVSVWWQNILDGGFPWMSCNGLNNPFSRFDLISHTTSGVNHEDQWHIAIAPQQGVEVIAQNFAKLFEHVFVFGWCLFAVLW